MVTNAIIQQLKYCKTINYWQRLFGELINFTKISSHQMKKIWTSTAFIQ